VGRGLYDAVCNGFDGEAHGLRNDVLVLLWDFERRELAGEQARRHVLVVALRHAGCDQLLVAFEIDEEDRLARGGYEVVAIGAFQGRASAYRDALVVGGGMQRFGERREPRPPVIIGKRDAGSHFLLVGWRVVVVAIEKRRVQPPGDGFAGRRLAARGDAHDDDGAGRNERHQTVADMPPST